MPDTEPLTASTTAPSEPKFVQGLGFLDSTMIVAGSMIGSGIFIVSADIARQVGSGGWLLMVWLVTGVLTITAALSYGELAAMMPKAGGQYIYLREAYSPLWGFLYGWTLFLVIQTGTIAAVGSCLRPLLGVLVPSISPEKIGSSSRLTFRPNTRSAFRQHSSWAILLIILLTLINTRGLKLGKLIQNIFTSAKTLSLIALIFIGIVVGRNADAIKLNFWRLLDPYGVERSIRMSVPSPRLSLQPVRLGFSSPFAWRKSARFSRRMPGTTSPSPPAR